MLILNELAQLVCLHQLGKVQIEATQNLVTVEKKRVLVSPNPEGRSISGCPMYGALIKPCLHTLNVTEGYSHLVRIEGRHICLDTVSGLTDGTPPGVVRYKVNFAGQTFVSEKA
jgi:hypothetical protein